MYYACTRTYMYMWVGMYPCQPTIAVDFCVQKVYNFIVNVMYDVITVYYVHKQLAFAWWAFSRNLSY